MRLAILILAHKNIQQIGRLAKILYNKDIDIFVHFDKKMIVSEKDITDLCGRNSNLYVCEKRVSCFLDTWSLVEATYELMKLAQKQNHYEYYALLSGQDYPIKSVDDIMQYLSAVYPKPIIDCTPYSRDNWIYSGFKRVRRPKLHDTVRRFSGGHAATRKVLMIPIYAYECILTLIYGRPIERLKRENCDLYGGSAWWILPDVCVSFIINEINNNTNIVKAFKLKTTPEETFFQTMVMRTELKSLVELNRTDETSQNCMTYAYFQDVNKPATGHPYIFTDLQFDMIKSLPHLFARKFDVTVCSNIMDRIDNEILKSVEESGC